MKKLTSILEHSQNLNENEILTNNHRWKKHINRINFGKMNISKEMLLPVDKKGKIIQNPNAYYKESMTPEERSRYMRNIRLYVMAMDNVLFEGISYDPDHRVFYIGKDYPSLESVHIGILQQSNNEFYSLNFKTIEDMVPLGLMLTATTLRKYNI